MTNEIDGMYSGEIKGIEKTAAPMPITREAWEAYRSAFRSLGPCHRNVDRWRHDLKWNVPESVVANYLAPERAKLVESPGHA